MRRPAPCEVAERHRGQRRLADPRRAADQDQRAGNEAAAEDPVELADPGRQPRVTLGPDVRQPHRLDRPPGRASAAPAAPAPSPPRPACSRPRSPGTGRATGRLGAAGGADEDGGGLGHGSWDSRRAGGRFAPVAATAPANCGWVGNRQVGVAAVRVSTFARHGAKSTSIAGATPRRHSTQSRRGVRISAPIAAALGRRARGTRRFPTQPPLTFGAAARLPTARPRRRPAPTDPAGIEVAARFRERSSRGRRRARAASRAGLARRLDRLGGGAPAGRPRRTPAGSAPPTAARPSSAHRERVDEVRSATSHSPSRGEDAQQPRGGAVARRRPADDHVAPRVGSSSLAAARPPRRASPSGRTPRPAASRRSASSRRAAARRTRPGERLEHPARLVRRARARPAVSASVQRQAGIAGYISMNRRTAARSRPAGPARAMLIHRAMPK